MSPRLIAREIPMEVEKQQNDSQETSEVAGTIEARVHQVIHQAEESLAKAENILEQVQDQQWRATENDKLISAIHPPRGAGVRVVGMDD
jgi:hypothetical protein